MVDEADHMYGEICQCSSKMPKTERGKKSWFNQIVNYIHVPDQDSKDKKSTLPPQDESKNTTTQIAVEK